MILTIKDPSCRCTKCGDPFGDGEEMYLQGAAIWHPRSDLVEEEDGNSDEDDVGPV